MANSIPDVIKPDINGSGVKQKGNARRKRNGEGCLGNGANISRFKKRTPQGFLSVKNIRRTILVD